MDIDFLKTQHRSSKKPKSQRLSYDVEYTNIGEEEKSVEKKHEYAKASKKNDEKETAKTPPPAPTAENKIKKISWWQNRKLKKQAKKQLKLQAKQEKQVAKQKAKIEKQQAKEKQAQEKKIKKSKQDALAPSEQKQETAKQPEKQTEHPKLRPQRIEPQPETKITGVSSPATRLPRSFKDKKGIVVPPEVAHAKELTKLDQKDIEKIKKGEIANSFLDVNLIPEELEARLKPITKIRGLIWIAIFTFCFVLLIYGIMLWYQTNLLGKVLDTQNEIEQIDNQINDQVSWQTEAIAFNKKVENVANILDKHIYWTNFFALLEKYTLPDVYYDNLSGNVTGTFTLTATAPNYETVSRQIALFNQSEFISAVAVTSANSSEAAEGENTESKVKFSVSITVNPEVLNYYQGQL